MKRIIRNYVVRDPKPVMDAILRGVSNYTSLTFNPTVDNQLIFEDIMDININDEEKTELYINGVRYIINLDYRIENNKLIWGGDFVLKPEYVLVFISR